MVQEYATGASDEYVVSGNYALIKCEIPSFVADLVKVVSWENNNGELFAPNSASTYGTPTCEWIGVRLKWWKIKSLIPQKHSFMTPPGSPFCKIWKKCRFNPILCFLLIYIAVNQEYETEADNEYVILGNSAIMKCEIPSFVADLIQIVSWKDSSGNIFTPSTVATGIL